jgi:hypothetical protein
LIGNQTQSATFHTATIMQQCLQKTMTKKNRNMPSKTFLKKYKQTIQIEGQELVNEFFVAFSRFEYALKATIAYAKGNNGKVEPNWDRFISDVRDDFDKTKSKELTEAVDFLLNNPPRIQILIHDSISWTDRVFSINTRDINKLSLHIRDIRNNLFHGGKFNGDFQRDVSRNYILINSALIVINELVILRDDVRNNFLSDIA